MKSGDAPYQPSDLTLKSNLHMKMDTNKHPCKVPGTTQLLSSLQETRFKLDARVPLPTLILSDGVW